MPELLAFAKLYGAPAALILFFVWRDYKREERHVAREKNLIERLTKVEDFQRDKLEGLASRSTAAMEDGARTMREVCSALGRRPCIAREMGMLGSDGGK